MIFLFLSMKPQAQTVLLLSLVIVLGMLLGKIKALGISLGIGGVLFAGLLCGHFIALLETSNSGVILLNRDILEFLREFGLVLFVYTIGMQVGPGFFASFKKDGLFLNILAATIVFLGVVTAGTIHLVSPKKFPVDVAVGLLAGSTTNTPGLGAGQQVLADVVAKRTYSSNSETAVAVISAKETSSMSYAVSYPFGIVGIILAMIAIRIFFRLNPVKSANNFARAQGSEKLMPTNVNLKVLETSALGLRISELAKIAGSHVVISRHRRHDAQRGDVVEVACPDTKLFSGDIIHAVGPKSQIEHLQELTGPITDLDLRKVDSNLQSRRILVSEGAVLGKTVESLGIQVRYGIMITRVIRAGIEFPQSDEVKLNFGDILVAVGPSESIDQVAKYLGDSIHQYNHPLLIPMFVGIVLGTILGSIPIPMGLPVPLKLGLAGGPLLVALILSRFGKVGKFVFHIPAGANLWVRELGIVLFLACVGLMSGGKIVETLLHGDGLSWMLAGVLITFVPIILVGFGARYFYKTNYMQLCGLLAGSMTDPPALAFASGIAQSEGPAITYATVYPLVMFLRILSCQLFVIIISQLSS
jgi:putative transport protein